ncbi:hypothetical protein ACH4E8_29585 [Streptomyces sp. NPDC017979]
MRDDDLDETPDWARAMAEDGFGDYGRWRPVPAPAPTTTTTTTGGPR